MNDFEERIREAFEEEASRTAAPPDLRRRVIGRAVRTPRRPGSHRVRWPWAPGTLSPRAVTLLAAATALAVVGAGVGVYVGTRPASAPPLAGRTPPPSATASPTLATASPPPLPAFGLIPGVRLTPSQGVGGSAGPGTVVPYFGPASLRWTGALPALPAGAEVWRFALAQPADADAFARRLNGSLVTAGPPVGGHPGTREYRAPGDVHISISFGDPTFGIATFTITPPPSPANPGADPAAVAANLLGRLNVDGPPLPGMVTVAQVIDLGQGTRVVVEQPVALVTPQITAGLVDGEGNVGGTRVAVDASGSAVQAAGPLFGAGSSHVGYPLRTAADAAQAAITAPPATPAADGPIPSVDLTRAVLVYAVVTAGDLGYVEPAYLFSGTFVRNGVTMEKRVLVPAVAVPALQP